MLGACCWKETTNLISYILFGIFRVNTTISNIPQYSVIWLPASHPHICSQWTRNKVTWLCHNLWVSQLCCCYFNVALHPTLATVALPQHSVRYKQFMRAWRWLQGEDNKERKKHCNGFCVCVFNSLPPFSLLHPTKSFVLVDCCLSVIIVPFF